MKQLTMLDLCCGLKGASEGFKQRGWKVYTLDIDPRFNPDYVADVRYWSWQGERLNFIWASSPCDEFARESMPWCRTGKQPDMSLVIGCKRIINECDPELGWVLENVRGAQAYLGKSVQNIGAFHFWGRFPLLGNMDLRIKKKESYGSKQEAERAKIPLQISTAFAIKIESQLVLIK